MTGIPRRARVATVLWSSFVVAAAATTAALLLADLPSAFDAAWPGAAPFKPLAAYTWTFLGAWSIGLGTGALLGVLTVQQGSSVGSG